MIKCRSFWTAFSVYYSIPKPFTAMLILLDNGHGKDTEGRVSPVWPNGSKMYEYEFNRDVVTRIYGALNLLGIRAVNLVPEAIDISLADRVKRANEYGKDSLYISVHGNAAPEINTGTGWEVFCYKKGIKADEIARVFSAFASAHLRNFRNRGVKYEADFYVLKNTIMPAILTENLFFDSERDCLFMLSEEGRQEIANLHVNAIKSLLNIGL